MGKITVCKNGGLKNKLFGKIFFNQCINKMKKILLSFFIASIFFISTSCTKTPAAPVPTLLDTVTVAGGNGRGSAANQFYYPTGLYVDSIGNVYVADFHNHRVQKWPPGADSGITVAGGNGEGSAANQLAFPEGIVVDKKGNIFIADYLNGRIQKWAPGADSGITVAGGIAANQLGGPTAIFIDASGNMYVSERDGARIQKFPPNSSSNTIGVTVAGGNGNGIADNQLGLPTGVSLDPSGNIFVSEDVDNRVQEFPVGSTTATNGITVAGAGDLYGASPNSIDYPPDVWVDSLDNIYVPSYNRILKFAHGSVSYTVFAGDSKGVAGNAYNQLNTPSYIFFDAGAKNLYISDGDNNRVQKWGLK
jgi:streptogramin lyase